MESLGERFEIPVSQKGRGRQIKCPLRSMSLLGGWFIAAATRPVELDSERVFGPLVVREISAETRFPPFPKAWTIPVLAHGYWQSTTDCLVLRGFLPHQD